MSIKERITGSSQAVTLSQLCALAIILVLSFFMRLAMVDMVDGTVPIRNDAKEYYFYAVNMQESGVYSSSRPVALSGEENAVMPDATRPPGYALFLYPFVEVPPTEEMVHEIRVAQVILSTLLVLLAFLVFKVYVTNAWALAGTLLVGLSPHLVSMNIYMLTESLFAFLLILFVYVSIKAFQGSSAVLAVIAGAVLGFAMLVKSSLLYFFPFLLLLLACVYGKKFRYRTILMVCVGMVIVQSPWLARNWTTELPVAQKSKALVSLQNGSYPGLMYNDDPRTRGIPHRADPAYSDIDSYSDFISDVAKKTWDEPGKYISWYLFGKAQMMLSWDMVAGAGDIFIYAVNYSPYADRQPFVLTHEIMKVLHPVLMSLGLAGGVFGLVNAVRRRESGGVETVGIVMCGALVFYYFLLHIVVTPLPRYMIPLRPYFYGLAIYLLAGGTLWVYSRYEAGRRV